MIKLLKITLVLLLLVPQNCFAAQVGPSGLPLPRFVSLKSSRINLRVGPGRDYAVLWLYLKTGLPVEIIQEYDNWRRIRDADGAEGWVLQTLISGKRTALITPWAKLEKKTVPLFKRATETSPIIAQLEANVLGKITACDGQWCAFETAGYEGFVRQSEVWGAYPDEIFDE